MTQCRQTRDVSGGASRAVVRACVWLFVVGWALWLFGCSGLRQTQKARAGSAGDGAESVFTWAGEFVEADGRGIAPAEVTTEPQRSLAAKQAAKTAAIAGLKHRVSRLTVTGSQTLGSIMALNLSVKRAVEKYLQTAEVVHEQEIEPGIWEVRMRAPLAPIARILLDHKITPESVPTVPVADRKFPRDS